ncbi:Type I Iterative PKS [Exserohilum turcicum]
MAIVLFPDHVTDTRSILRQVHEARNTSTLVKSFLEKAYHALRHETWNLNPDVRHHIPPFNSVFDLSERYAACEVQRLEVSSALLCIAQLAQYIGHNERNDQLRLDANSDLLVGTGIGQLCAAAVACTATVVKLPDLAAEAVRLAFRIGSVVETYSVQNQRSAHSNESWSISVPVPFEKLQEELQTVQDDANLSVAGRAFITTVGISTCIISGNPRRLEWLMQNSGLLKSVQCHKLPSTGVWHAEHVYDDEHVAEIIDARAHAIRNFQLSPKSIISTRTGTFSEADTALSLFTEATQNILRYPIQFSTVAATIAGSLSKQDAPSVQLLGFQDCDMTESLRVFAETQTAKSVTVQSLGDWSLPTQPLPFRSGSSDPAIAIVGMSGRFPGAPDVDHLWDLLIQGRNMYREIPKDRFNVETHYDPEGKKNNSSHTPYGCFVEEPGLFDSRFFSMSPREATQTDPMHRLALVTAYEALEMSGFVLDSTPSSQKDRVGTFYGQTSDDWREVNAAQNIETYFIPGGVRAFAPGRINYHFGFRGPSYSVDTACSSSLAAIQVACSALKSGKCDTAVAGGVNIPTAPDIFAGLRKGQFFSKTGSCKTWDSKADGYCRADGVGSIVLKRLDDAVADKNNILGVILSTATNHSADAISITHPHAGNQASLYRSVMHDAGIDPVDVSYVEMHGTGTQAGDMAEIRSVSEVFAPQGSRGSSADKALYIGSVKANIGHGGAAAGIGALIKILLMLRQSVIPQHIGIQHEINPRFPDLQSLNMRVPFDNTPWRSQNGLRRIAFLNNFSAAGGNTAMLIQEGPEKEQQSLEPDPRTWLPFVTSAKSLSSLKKNVQRLIDHLGSISQKDFSSLSYTLTSRRMHHNYRVAVTVRNLDELKTSLAKRVQEGDISPIPSASPEVTFVFTGQGAFYAELGKALMESSKQFRSTIQHLDKVSQGQGFPSFLPALAVAETETLSPTVVQLALVCVQIALVHLWRSWGVVPSLVIGHSLGEYAALYTAGVLSMEDTIYLVGARAQLMEAKCKQNTHAMLAVRASEEDVKLAVGNLPFDIACLNSPGDTVLAGTAEEIAVLSGALKEKGLQCTQLNLPYAFHSAQVDPILSPFENLAAEVIFTKPQIPVLSSLLGDVVNSEGIFNAQYLCQHARECVDFVQALEIGKIQGHITAKTVFLEIGPHPICSKMVKNTLSPTALTASSLVKGEQSWKSLSTAVCALHCAGIAIDFREFHRDFESSHTLLDLPSYSFDNKNYWIDYVNDWCLHKVEPRNVKAIEGPPSPPQSRLSTSSVHRITSESFQNGRATVTSQSDLSDPTLRAAVQGHQVNNTSLFSSSIYADIALTLGDYVYKRMNPEKPAIGVSCGDMEVFKPLIIKGSDADTRVLETVDAVSKQSVLHATCVVTFEDTAAWTNSWNNMAYLIEGRIDTLKERLVKNQADKMSRALVYRLFSSLVDYKLPYQGMEEVIIDGANFEATSRVAFQTKSEDGNFFCNPYGIDSLMHLAGFILNGGSGVDAKQFVYISHGWKALRFAVPPQQDKVYHSYVKMQPTGESNIMAGDVYVFENGKIIAMCVGLKFQRIPRTVLNTFLPPQVSSLDTVAQPRIEKKTEAPANITAKNLSTRPKVEKVKADLHRQPPSTVTLVMDVISAESELPLSELHDDCMFSDLGIDSLLSLQILGKLREDLDLDLPGDVFVKCETIGDLRRYLGDIQGDDGTSSASSSASPVSTAVTTPSIMSDEENSVFVDAPNGMCDPLQASLQMVKGESSGAKLLSFFRETIAEQMDIAMEEVVGSNDLLSLGMDSLMSICILGIIREKTELDLPSDFFQKYTCIDEIEQFLNPVPIEKPKGADRVSRATRGGTTRGQRETSQPTSRLPRAVSMLLQGKPRTASKVLFLIPDGSGSATSYASIPAIDPSIAVYGLNSPYMKSPSLFTNGIPGIATQYLEEVRRRQPVGPYHLGGWSAGGVVAYEMTLQLMAAESLPSRLHHFFAEIGLIGIDEGSKVPDWLLDHFEASIKALTAYEPQPISDNHMSLAPRTMAVWARYGVCRYPDSPRPEVKGDEPKSMNWLLNNRTDFGPNGWEALLKSVEIQTMTMEGNHFTLMKEKDELKELASAIRKFL